MAEHSTYLEVAYLLIHGELPTSDQLTEWTHQITTHTFVHENLKSFMHGFRYDAHPMGMLLASVGALSTFYPDANLIHDDEVRQIQMVRLISKMPTLAAFAYRHSRGMPYVYPDNDLSYAGNFLSMIYKIAELKYQPDPRLERALDVLFILHADHEQNCSTSCRADRRLLAGRPVLGDRRRIAALYGPLHGGANEAVLRMLRRIETKDRRPRVHRGSQGRQRAPDGLRPSRLQELRSARDDHQEGLRRRLRGDRSQPAARGRAVELEKIALGDEYFVSRKLYPNVDFYSGLIYEALGMPVEMFPVLFAIGRTSGWIAQWLEMVEDPEQKIARPRQIYTGARDRDWVSPDSR